MERLQRGRYQMSFEPIYDGVEEVAEYEITERYVRRLEAMIPLSGVISAFSAAALIAYTPS